MSTNSTIKRGSLYVVATPIGNLGDMTFRAVETLKQVDVIAAEDTRHTKPLLAHFGIAAKRMIAVHDHNEGGAAQGIIGLLREGKTVALVTDAGTPAVSDPGAIVVAAVREAGFEVVPVPGASAVIAALSASGEGERGFVFHGFLPVKQGDRIKQLTPYISSNCPVIFYEAPHRVVESVEGMAMVFGDNSMITFCRELTKKFESIHRLPLGQAVEWLKADEDRQRGEFVLIVSPVAAVKDDDAELRRTLELLLAELPLKQAVALAVKITGEKKNTVYELALKLKSEIKLDP